MCIRYIIILCFVAIQFTDANVSVDNTSSDGGVEQGSFVVADMIVGGVGEGSLVVADRIVSGVGQGSPVVADMIVGGVGQGSPVGANSILGGISYDGVVGGVGAGAQETSTDLEIDEVKSLYQEMFTSYNALIRPRLDLNEPVIVLTRFVPYMIVQFNTQAQVFSLFGYFVFEWHDEVLANASSFNGTLRITRDHVWSPPVRIAQSVGLTAYVGDKFSDIIGIQTNGSMQWVPEGAFSFVCEVNVEFYPFDTQKCTFTYYVEGEKFTSVDLRYVGKVDLTEYVENAEWNLIYSRQSTRLENNVTFIDLYFKVERRGSFETMTVLVPPISMSLISGFPFLMPISYGEKGTISIMVFFGYTIFMTVIVDSLPHNSLHVSFLVIYTIYLLSGSIFLVLYSIVQHKIYSVVRYENWRAVLRISEVCCNGTDGRKREELWLKIFPKIDICVFIAISVFNILGTSTLLSLLFSHKEN